MRDWRCRHLLDVVLSVVLMLGFAGCSHGQQQGASSQLMFVTSPETHTISLFKVSAEGDAPPITTIKEESSDIPVDVSTDAAGQVFVANANGNIKVYAGQKFQYQLVRTITGPHTELYQLTGIAADRAGDCFITEVGKSPNDARIQWFAAGLNGNILPDWKVMGPKTQITDPRAIALDGSGRIYIADAARNAVLVFDSDPRGDVAPIVTLTKSLHTPQRVTVDADVNVWVTNADGSVTMYFLTGPQSWDLGATFTSKALSKPHGIAVDAAGRVAIASSGSDSILFFAPGSKGVVTPVQDLRGPTHMTPMGLVIH